MRNATLVKKTQLLTLIEYLLFGTWTKNNKYNDNGTDSDLGNFATGFVQFVRLVCHLKAGLDFTLLCEIGFVILPSTVQLHPLSQSLLHTDRQQSSADTSTCSFIRNTTNTFCGTWYLPHSQFYNEQTVPIIMAGCIAHA